MVQAVIAVLAPANGVEEVTITEEAEYFPPPRNLREMLTSVDVVATFGLGGNVDARPPLDDRVIGAADVLASISGS
ncbi:MAG: hypothetical protein R2710_22455 [Acidimicrobiales bacterium]